MKKSSRLLFATMMVVALAVTLFVGCKKEKDETVNQPEKTEAQALMGRIKAFQTLCESASSEQKAEGVMSVEEMRQILDLVANYEYSEHMTSCENTILDTLYVPMPPVDEEGNVKKMDVVSTYETFETELQQLMARVDDNRDVHSYFSIVMPKDAERADGYITVVFVRGEESKETRGGRNTYDEDGPFVEGYDWYWGDNLGLCKWNPYNATSDASKELSYMFHFVIPEGHQGESYFVQNVVHVNYRPSVPDVYYGFSQYYEDVNMEDCADTWLFCYISLMPLDQCLMWYELNCYWRSINRNIVDPDAPLHYVGFNSNNVLVQVPYHCCSITWHRFDYQGYYYQIHVAHVTYCDILWETNPFPPID